MGRVTAYRGIIVHSKGLNDLEVLNPGFIGVDGSDGTITFVEKTLQPSSTSNSHYDEVIDCGDNLILPGFVDGHAHAPQHSYLGVGMHLPLLDWLNTYAFRYEAKFANAEYAQQVYTRAIRRQVANGTTTCSYFGSTHLAGNKVLADVIEHAGQRAYIGKVNMDRNCPEDLLEDTNQSLEDTKSFVSYVFAKKNKRLTPALTPRFVPSVTAELMKGLGELSRQHEPWLPVQSHLSENIGEIEWVKNLHPEYESYTDVMKQHGLLHHRSYMAHCIWCSDSEREILRDAETAVIHCPNSNFSLLSGVLDVRRLLDEGVTVGLGTDVSGGYSASMLDAIRQAAIASKLVSMGNGSNSEGGENHALSFDEVFYLATLGGARALDLGDTIGNFIVGKQFDALVVDVYTEDGPIDRPIDDDDKSPEKDTLRDFQKFLFNGDDRNIRQVYVDGRRIKG